ncbi:MAG: hypothetical protein E7289_08385 [Lachnospiraceae bacterium]|nr:hypothetical protein [Lachnospiraceae bacterium]
MACKGFGIQEAAIHDAFIRAWNEMVENRGELLQKWKAMIQDGNELEKLRARQFTELTKAKPLKSMDIELVSKVLEYCNVFEDTLEFHFKDGTTITQVWENKRHQ